MTHKQMIKPQIIEGDIFSDVRGEIRFLNDFHLQDIRRFYIIRNTDLSTVRAWQGHRKEKKYFYPIAGSLLITWVKLDDFENPSDHLIPDSCILSAEKSEILFIPEGYANGIKALKPDSQLMVFSDMLLSESQNDEIRFPTDKWFDWHNLKPLSS